MKRIFLLTIVILWSYSAKSYDFSSICNTGQLLYYNINSNNRVTVTYPQSFSSNYYQGYSKTYRSFSNT